MPSWHERISRISRGFLGSTRRPVNVRVLGALLVAVAAGFSVEAATAHNPTWAAGAINTAHALGLSPYRAATFQRERVLPYPAITVDDPNLPAGMHQVRTPGLTGAVLETGIALYRTPIPVRTPPSAARAAAAAPGTASRSASASTAAGRTASGSASGTGAPLPGPAPAEVKVLASTVLAQPKEAVIAVGTSTTCVQVNGRCYHFSRVLDVIATAYDATWASNGPWTGQRSAIGLPLNYGIVAVDPRVIPLGTRLYVEHYGLAIAADTGSAIVGDHIDLFFWDTPQQTAAFGIRHLKVYVIDDSRLPSVPVPPAIQRTLG